MNASEWLRTLPLIERYDSRTKEMLEDVLVRGLRQSDAARKYGISRQRVSGLVRRIEDRLYPSDWRLVAVWLPPVLADEVEKTAECAVAARGKRSQQRPPACSTLTVGDLDMNVRLSNVLGPSSPASLIDEVLDDEGHPLRSKLRHADMRELDEIRAKPVCPIEK